MSADISEMRRRTLQHMERQAMHMQRLQAYQHMEQEQISEQPDQPAQVTQQPSPDVWQTAFKSAVKVGAEIGSIACEEKSKRHLKKWIRHPNFDDAVAGLGLRFLDHIIKRLDESLDN